jgi:hypothetical protein
VLFGFEEAEQYEYDFWKNPNTKSFFSNPGI